MSPARWTLCLIVAFASSSRAADPATRTDLAGDPLPPGAVARIGTARFVPRPQLEQVFFTPDGASVLGRGGDNVIPFWETETGKPAGELRDPDLINFKVDQSPDGTRLAFFGSDKRGKPAPDTTLRVYDLATRKPVWSKTIDDVYHVYHNVRYSADGKYLITATQAELRVWDAATGAVVTKQKGAVGYQGMIMSPDGRLVAGGEQMLWVWDWQTGGPPQRINLRPDRRYYNLAAFSLDSKTLYTRDGFRDEAHGYDVASGNFVEKADPSLADWYAVSPDGKTIARAAYDKQKRAGFVALRDVATGKEVGRLPSGGSIVRAGRWSKDGSRFAAATPYRAWAWDVKTGRAFGPAVPSHDAQVVSLSFVSDGRLITASEDHSVRAWDPATGKELARLIPDAGYLFAQLAVSQDGSLLAGTPRPNEMHVWDAKTGKEIYKLVWTLNPTGGMRRVQFSADDQTLLSYGTDLYLRAWDMATGKLKAERRFRPGAPPGAEDEEEMLRMNTGIGDPRAVDISPDGDTLVLGVNKEVTAYSLRTGKVRFQMEADGQRIEAALLSPDGKRLAVAGTAATAPPAQVGVPWRPDVQVTVWDIAQGKRLSGFRTTGSTFYPRLAFTPDGKQVVTGANDDRLVFWNAADGTVTGAIELPRPPSRVAFSPDGKRLAVASWDPSVLVFDVAAAMKAVKE